MSSDHYALGAVWTGFIVFVGTWIWCISEYGFLLGVGLGWLPSAIVAFLAAWLWPLIAIAVAWLAYMIFIK